MKNIAFLLLHLLVFNLHGQVKYSKGLVFDDNANQYVQKKVSLIRGDYEHIPDKASVKNFAPHPGNQIQLSTSPSWAAVYGAKTILDAQIQKWNTRDEITRNASSPVFNYTVSTDFNNNNCTAGITLTGVLESLKRFGVPKYIDFQEFCPKSIPIPVYSQAGDHKITDYVKLFDEQDAPEAKLEAMKKSLSENNPVVIGMICPPSFYIARDFWQPREKVSNDFDGHALCVVGYDDAKYGGSFEVMNSWGRKWGNDGFIWIRYPDFLDFTRSAYEMFIIEQDNGHDFSGEIKLVLEDGQFMETRLTNNQGYYQTNKPYSTGTNFRIYISNNETAYVYVFGTDKTNEYFKLFPYEEHVSPVLNYKSSSVALPGEKQHIRITGDPGRDYLVILYSKEEIDLPLLMEKLKNTPGRIDERLRLILGKYIVDPHDMQWDQTVIKFTGSGKGKTLVPVFLEIEHN
jgi:hypothetical protein